MKNYKKFLEENKNLASSVLIEKKNDLDDLEIDAVRGVEPRKYTSSQKKKVIDYFSKMSMPNLRKRQDLVKSQQEMAFNMNQKAKSRQEQEKALDATHNLNMIDDLLMAAVDKKNFG